jgi:release factor glutamine methyltransferase
VTLHEHIVDGRRRLREAGIAPQEADLDARLLAEVVLGWDAARILTGGGDEPLPDFEGRYRALLTRRAAREPVAYITGTQEFWGLPIEVSPAVLIPRPETELIVETVLDLVPDRSRPLRLADVCTGSGCLVVALARELPRARAVATDVSLPALEVARRNARRHDVAGRVALAATDLLQAVSVAFDVIVANPPYVPDTDRPTLPPEVREHEPPLALYGGRDGLATIARLIATAPRNMPPGGLLAFEFGFGQESAVSELISSTSALRMVDIRRDLQGIPRTAVAARR